MKLNEYLTNLGTSENTAGLTTHPTFTLEEEVESLSYEISQAEADFNRILTTVELLEKLKNTSEALANQDTTATFSHEDADMVVKVANAQSLRLEGENFSFTKDLIFEASGDHLVLTNKSIGQHAAGIGKNIQKAITKLWEALKKFISDVFSEHSKMSRLASKLERADYDLEAPFNMSDKMKLMLNFNGTALTADPFKEAVSVSDFALRSEALVVFKALSNRIVRKRKNKDEGEEQKTAMPLGPVYDDLFRSLSDAFEITDDIPRGKEQVASATFKNDKNSALSINLSHDDANNQLKLTFLCLNDHHDIDTKNKKVKLSDGFRRERNIRAFATTIATDIKNLDETYSVLVKGDVKEHDLTGSLSSIINVQMQTLKGVTRVYQSALALLGAAAAASKK